ncbi:hypothetical protein [Bacillus sp. Marseille-P3661]|uniref:hypothetical protein n=1 Tax=Bacillus sp. Marseille-P3661 TaxID=1936234 RepID=UPI0015E192C7|nr:hypothetical protein [Bacillus sp. Marseille-P3661]
MTNEQHALIIDILRHLLENEELAKHAMTQMDKIDFNVSCGKYAWTGACSV